MSPGSGTEGQASVAGAENVERVLPDPVGARISVWSRAAIAGQPLQLRRRGFSKGRSEPVPDRLRETLQRIDHPRTLASPSRLVVSTGTSHRHQIVMETGGF